MLKTSVYVLCLKVGFWVEMDGDNLEELFQKK